MHRWENRAAERWWILTRFQGGAQAYLPVYLAPKRKCIPLSHTRGFLLRKLWPEMNLRGYPCNPLFAIKIIFFLKKSFVTFLLPNRISPRETKDAQLSLKSVIDWATLKISQESFWPYWVSEARPAFLHIWDMNSGLGSPSTEIAFVRLQRQPTGLLYPCFCCQVDLFTY